MMNAVEENKVALMEKNYVRKADPKNNYWFSFYVGKMMAKANSFGKDFFLIVHGSKQKDGDYYVIPYSLVEHILTDGNTTKIDNNAKDANVRTPRWCGNIIENGFHVTNSGERIEVSEYYGNRILLARAMGRSDLSGFTDVAQLDSGSGDMLPYNPEDISDARNKVVRTITQRRGQKSFRDSLLEAYARQCAVTGCSIVDVLEAAHITPYLGPETNHVANGLLLRADLHVLLDCGLMAIDPETCRVLLAPSIREAPDYKDVHGKRLREPTPLAAAPNRKAMEDRLRACSWSSCAESMSN